MAFHSQLVPSVARPTPVERLLVPPTPRQRGDANRNREFMDALTGDDDAASADAPFPDLHDETDAMTQDGGDDASFLGLSFLERRFGFQR